MSLPVKFLVFFLCSIPLVFISWRTLFNVRSHGFYRFFSWECILWLGINNFPYWYKAPFSLQQIFSWIFLIYSLVLIVFGVLMMNKAGNPDSNRKDDNLYQFEKTTALIKTGLFRYIRHPLYGSLLFLTWGIFLKQTTLFLLIVTVLSTVLLIITAKIEEQENIRFFGEEYSEYIKETWLFVPYIF